MQKILMSAGVLAAFGLLAACPPRVNSGGGQPGAKPEQPVATAQDPAAPQGPQPDIELIESRFNAGTVKQGAVVSHTFVVKNRGLGELNIEKVKGS